MNTFIKQRLAANHFFSAFFMINRQPSFLLSQATMRAFSTNQQTRIYGERSEIRYPEGFAKDILKGP